MTEHDTAAVAIDFETFWSSDYSLKKMSTYAYVWDARFDAYLVAVSGEHERWVGDPKQFDWMSIQGRPVLMHNAQFDWLVLMRLQELGIIPEEYKPGAIYDTADLAAFLKLPRSLAGATEQAFGRVLDKSQRELAKGKTGREILTGLDADKMLAYGIGDADATLSLWRCGADKWPHEEREMSRLNREAAWYGVRVDRKHIEDSIAELKHKQFEAVSAIPWYPDSPALSPKALRIEARKNDMWVPASLSQTDAAFQKWVTEYSEKYPWVKACGAYRKINTMLKRFEALLSGTRPDDTYVYQLKYHGAATGRMSGGGDSGGKFNMQNMPRDEENKDFDFTTDLRGCIVARPGHVLGVMDYSNVEARVLLWRVKDTATLTMIQSGMDVYEAHARLTMGYNLDIPLKKAASLYPKYDTLRRLSKSRILGLGYGCWKDTFKTVAKTMAGLDLTDEECKATVMEYRDKNPGIVNLWAQHQYALSVSADQKDSTHEVELASGRILTYFNPRRAISEKTGRPSFTVSFIRGDHPRYIYGGLLTENEIQATARDLLRDAWIKVTESGYRVLFTVHDEFVFELPQETAEEDMKKIRAIVLSASPWAAGCPLDVEYSIVNVYNKA